MLDSVFFCKRTDSTIAHPRKKQRFSLTNVSWPLDTRKDTIKKKDPCIKIFLVCKRLSIHDVGVSRDTVFQERRPRSGLKRAISVKKSWGGATVVRLKDTRHVCSKNILERAMHQTASFVREWPRKHGDVKQGASPMHATIARCSTFRVKWFLIERGSLTRKRRGKK